MLRAHPGIIRRVFSHTAHTSTTAAALAHGLAPPAFDAATHAARTLAQLRSKDKDIEKNIFLTQLRAYDENLFYKIAVENVTEVTPLIYTPTVGDACLQYSANFRRPEGLVCTFNL
jgi:malate dehydrogenase (oxaloacetate-decarboxylating)(NADP+)